MVILIYLSFVCGEKCFYLVLWRSSMLKGEKIEKYFLNRSRTVHCITRFLFEQLTLGKCFYSELKIRTWTMEYYSVTRINYVCKNWWELLFCRTVERCSFFNPIQKRGGGKKAPPNQFFPCNFYIRRIRPPKLSGFQF